MKDPSASNNEEREYPHWGRVYLAVLINTAIVIMALWLFSKAFR